MATIINITLEVYVESLRGESQAAFRQNNNISTTIHFFMFYLFIYGLLGYKQTPQYPLNQILIVLVHMKYRPTVH